MKIVSFVTLLLWLPCFLEAQIYSPQIDSVMMRDGKKLAADVYIVSGGNPKPTILIQTPYNRLYYRWGLPIGVGSNLNSYGYNFVIADWRGFYGSVGAIVATPNRGEDGYDLIEWIAQQTWSDGKVGTWGPSALGKVQYQTAKEDPPHLTCCVPLVAGSQFDYSEYYPGGVYRTEYVQQLDGLGYRLSPFILANPFYSITWQYLETTNYYPSTMKVPCFMIGGWYDHNVELMLELFSGIRQLSPANVKDKHKLLMGPWAHGGFGMAQVGTCTQGELTFNEACGWSDSLAMRFFDFYLKNQANGWDNEPVIKYFQIGENVWNSTLIWPLNGLTNQKFYFQNGGLLNGSAPVTSNSSSTFIYNPADPSPTHGGPTLRQDQLQGPYDQSGVVESRNDISVFTSQVLTSPVQVAGSPVVRLFVKSDRKDTDFAIRFCDVYPDGRSMLISDGIQRMRFRNGFTVADTASMNPLQIYQVDIALPNTAYTFLTGHAIRVDITSSNYPRFDNNLNNGLQMYTAGDTLIASNRVYHETGHESYIQLPVTAGNYVSDIKNDKPFFIYPDPASTYIQMRWDMPFSESEVIILNSLGQTIKQMIVQQNEVIDITHLKAGLYLVKYRFDKNEYSVSKFIVFSF